MSRRPRHHPRKCPSVPSLGRLRGLGRVRASEPVYDSPTVRELLDRLPGGPWPWAAGAGVAALWVLFRNRPGVPKDNTGDSPWTWPLDDDIYITSYFGARPATAVTAATDKHGALDLVHVTGGGDTVYAARGGVVADAGYTATGGNYIVLVHPDGHQSAYFHLAQIAVAVGEKPEKGDAIGTVGCTGSLCAGAHLHFEIRAPGTPIGPFPGMQYHLDPLNYLPGEVGSGKPVADTGGR